MNTTDPAYHKLHRGFLAACILLAPLVLAGWFTLCPQYGDPTCPNTTQPEAVFAAFRAANPALLRIFFGLNLLIPYLYPISYIGLGLVAMKKSPWWSTIGIVFGWFGSIAWGFIAGYVLILNTAIHLDQDASFAALAKAFFSIQLTALDHCHWLCARLHREHSCCSGTSMDKFWTLAWNSI